MKTPIHLLRREFPWWPSPRVLWGLSAIVLLGVVALAADGCRPDKPPAGARNYMGGLEAQGIGADDLFQPAIQNLNHLEEFGGEMLPRVIERLNQWAEMQEAPPNWKPDPLLQTLPKSLRQLPAVKTLGKLEFRPREDSLTLQATVWLRDISKWSCGEASRLESDGQHRSADFDRESVRGKSELEQAMDLFDWTVRNIQLTRKASGGPANQTLRRNPWAMLLFGSGSSMEQAWLFILLARQRQIDAAILALPDPDDPSGGRLRPWAVGVLCEGKIYVFDTSLGLPIPAPKGISMAAGNTLRIQPATLGQLAADPALLRQLDLDPQRPYPIRSEDLEQVVALIEGSPACLSLRMKMVEDNLSAGYRMVLTTDATAQAKRFTAVRHVGDAKLWTMPLVTLHQWSQLERNPALTRQLQRVLLPMERSPALSRGRVAHLKGNLDGEEGATIFYQQARPADVDLSEALAAKKISPADSELLRQAKQNASYWMGLVSYALGNDSTAVDYFRKRTLEASPDGPWTHGARYNLARTYEAMGRHDQAIHEYESDLRSPRYRGNVLRARWLRAALAQRGT